MILTIRKTREWLGARLGRRGPVSDATWRQLCDQGLPVGLIGSTPYCSTEAIDAWLELRASQPELNGGVAPGYLRRGYAASTVKPRPSPAPEAKRRRGRPRKLAP